MTNDDLLQQLDTLIQNRLEENNKQLRQELQEDIKAVETKLSQDIKAVEKNLSEQISREANDLASIMRDVIIPKIEQHDTDIADLREAVGLKPRWQ
jgi:hypothetical protein